MRARFSSVLGERPGASGICALALAAACARPSSAIWPTGVLRQEGPGRVGAEEGEWSYYYADGQMRERGSWTRGRRDGRWTQWWPNGQRASEGERIWQPEARASEREGPWSFWHPNGQKSGEGSFHLGLREGSWLYWQEDGAADVASGWYEHDVRVR